MTMSRRRTNPQRKPPPKPSKAISNGTQRTGEMSPLQYLLRLVNDETADASRRDMAARCAAQYVHPKAGDLGKKDAEAAAAEKAGGREWGDDLAAMTGRSDAPCPAVGSARA